MLSFGSGPAFRGDKEAAQTDIPKKQMLKHLLGSMTSRRKSLQYFASWHYIY